MRRERPQVQARRAWTLLHQVHREASGMVGRQGEFHRLDAAVKRALVDGQDRGAAIELEQLLLVGVRRARTDGYFRTLEFDPESPGQQREDRGGLQILVEQPGATPPVTSSRRCLIVAEIRFEDVSCLYKGSPRPAVSGLELTVADGEFLVLVGPSGCGKTTSLRLLAGLEQASEGRILMGGKDVSRQSPSSRDIAMVFQSYALYPTMMVAENIEFPLKVAGVGKRERRERARKVAEMLELGDYLERKPRALSGGQRQRVAMGGAIVRRPRAFLLDEPLSNLDGKLRVETRTQIAALQRELGVTTVYVTHDQVEAMTMGDRVAVMRDGVLLQCDRPQEIYLRPANTFVAGFTGSPPMNLLHAQVTDRGADLGGYTVPIPRDSLAALNGEREIVVGLRPDAFALSDADGLPIRIGVIEILGSEAYAYGTTKIADTDTPIVLRGDPLKPPERGQTVHAQPNQDNVHIFNATSERRLESHSAASSDRSTVVA